MYEDEACSNNGCLLLNQRYWSNGTGEGLVLMFDCTRYSMFYKSEGDLMRKFKQAVILLLFFLTLTE